MSEGFGDRLRRLRKASNLGLADVAGRAGVSISYLSQLERGEKGNVSLAFALAISRALGCTLKAVAVGEPDRSADLRLAALPASPHAAAVEFLDMHGAWDTEFRANNPVRSMVTIHWGSVFEGGGRGMFLCEPCCNESEGFVYKIVFDEGSKSLFTWERRGSLRRSADFAEFVQRFRVGTVVSRGSILHET